MYDLLGFRFLRIDLKRIEGINPSATLTVEQVFQFVLEQNLGALYSYRFESPPSSVDLSLIVHSVEQLKFAEVHYEATNDPYVFRFQVNAHAN